MRSRFAFGLLVLVLFHATQLTAFAACTCSNAFQLQALGTTTLEIPLAWEPVSGAQRYIVERSASCDFSAPAAYTLSNAATGYGDTGRAPDDKHRFWPPGQAPSTIQSGVTYNYRVRAQLGDQSERISNCVAASLVTAPVRGVAGD